MAEEHVSCQRCGATNPPQNRFCGQCGDFLRSTPPQSVTRDETSRLLPAFRSMPTTPAKADTARLLSKLGTLGKPLAVGALALAAQAAVSWLVRRSDQPVPGTRPAPHTTAAAGQAREPEVAYYCEEIMLIFVRGKAHSSRLVGQRSGVFSRQARGR